MSLPDDLFLEIFPRVKDVVALFRCAIVCKRWRDLLISRFSFLSRCLPEEACHASSPFPGFFTQQRRRRNDLPAPCFVPGPRPVLGPRRLLSSFVPGMGGLAVPLTSRNGLLLVRVGARQLMVCNPLAGTFKPLPQLDHHWDSYGCFTGYAMLTAADCSISDQHNDEFPFFKVMIIVMAHYPMYYDLHTYSSVRELGWNKCSGSGGGDAGHAIHMALLQHNAAVCHGAAYWFLRGKLGPYIGVSTKTGHVRTIRVVNTRLCSLLDDPAYDEPYLSTNAEGMLAFLCLRTDGSRLDIITGREEPDFHIMLKPPSTQMIYSFEQGVVHKCLGEKNGMLIMKDNHQCIYVADVKTGVMQEITDCPRGHALSRREIVPFEMDWPALFISRLGVVAT